MNDMPDRQQGQKLLAQRVKDARWDGRHEEPTDHGALAPSRAWSSCLPSPISHAGRLDCAYWRRLLVTSGDWTGTARREYLFHASGSVVDMLSPGIVV
jgi:hypothetical protein